MQNQEENMKFSFRVEIMKSKAKEKAKSLIQLFALLHKEIARMPLKFMLFPLPAVKYANKNFSSTKRHSQIQRTRNRSNRTKKKITVNVLRFQKYFYCRNFCFWQTKLFGYYLFFLLLAHCSMPFGKCSVWLVGLLTFYFCSFFCLFVCFVCMFGVLCLTWTVSNFVWL